MRKSIACAVLLLVVGCTAPPPETPRQHLAALELVFIGVVDELSFHKARLSKETRHSVEVAIREVDTALDDAHTAIRLGLSPAQALIYAQAAIRRLQAAVPRE